MGGGEYSQRRLAVARAANRAVFSGGCGLLLILIPIALLSHFQVGAVSMYVQSNSYG